MAEKEDRRIVYTRKMLRNALLELMKDRPISKITTTDLCRKADIGRNTFYCHYRTPDDVLEELEDELFDKIMGNLKTATPDSIRMEHVLEEIHKNRAFFTILVSPYGHKEFLQRLIKPARIEQMSKQSADLDAKSLLRQEQAITFVTSGCVALIQQWVVGGMRQDIRELAESLAQFGRACLATPQS